MAIEDSISCPIIDGKLPDTTSVLGQRHELGVILVFGVVIAEVILACVTSLGAEAFLSSCIPRSGKRLR
jgi:hypothetical protein